MRVVIRSGWNRASMCTTSYPSSPVLIYYIILYSLLFYFLILFYLPSLPSFLHCRLDAAIALFEDALEAAKRAESAPWTDPQLPARPIISQLLQPLPPDKPITITDSDSAAGGGAASEVEIKSVSMSVGDLSKGRGKVKVNQVRWKDKVRRITLLYC